LRPDVTEAEQFRPFQQLATTNKAPKTMVIAYVTVFVLVILLVLDAIVSSKHPQQ